MKAGLKLVIYDWPTDKEEDIKRELLQALDDIQARIESIGDQFDIHINTQVTIEDLLP